MNKKCKLAAVMTGAILFTAALGGCASKGAEEIKVPDYSALMSTDYTYDSDYSDYVSDKPGLINPFIVGVNLINLRTRYCIPYLPTRS